MSKKLFLQWDDFAEDVATSFANLREVSDFTDVTLVCQDGRQFEAHRLILSSSSPVFQAMLKGYRHNHPLVYLRGVRSIDLIAILDFLYCGETNVFQEDLASFLSIAEELQLKGVMRGAEEEEDKQTGISSRKKEKPRHTDEAQIPKREVSAFPPNTKTEDFGNEISNDKVVLTSDLSFDFQKLDEQINTMMRKSPRKSEVEGALYVFYVCTICGKEGKSQHVKMHIEANHLEGISIPCNLCEKTLR